MDKGGAEEKLSLEDVLSRNKEGWPSKFQRQFLTLLLKNYHLHRTNYLTTLVQCFIGVFFLLVTIGMQNAYINAQYVLVPVT